MGTRDDRSTFVGPSRLAKITGRSREWARTKLREWLREQNAGGPQRVFVKSGKRGDLYTTISIIQREFVGVYDPIITRKLRDHDEAIRWLEKQVAHLTSEVHALRRRTS